MAYGYTIRFNSAGVDESALREAIERLGISGVSISRAPTSGPLHIQAGDDEFKPKTTKEVILDILGDNKLHRKKEILDVLKLTAGITNSAISKALELLVASKQVKKIRHGVYASPQAVPPPKPESTESLGPKEIQRQSTMAAEGKSGASYQPIGRIPADVQKQSVNAKISAKAKKREHFASRPDQRSSSTRLRRATR